MAATSAGIDASNVRTSGASCMQCARSTCS
jgi:hypothetical protein